MITCRLLLPGELRKYEYFMRARGMDSRSMYFGCALGDTAITQLVDGIIKNPTKNHILVAEDENLEIVGTIHIAYMSDHESELGVMVSEAYRGQGIASKMMEYAMTWCQNRSLRDVYMHCLSYNAPIIHLVKKHGLEVSREHGEADARVTLPPGNILTIGQEVLLNQHNTLHRNINQNIRSFRRILAY